MTKQAALSQTANSRSKVEQNATEGVIASTVELVTGKGIAEKNILMIPFGEHYGRDGRGPYILERGKHAEDVIAMTRAIAGSGDLPFDYNHQCFYTSGKGGEAKAAGWIKPATLSVGDGGIYADVEWVEAAEAALMAREYRYHSPYFRVDKKTRRVTRLVNASLTNTPNLDLPALASQDPGASPEEGKTMTKLIAAALSSSALSALALTAKSTDEDALAAIDQMVEDKSGTDAVLASVQTKLGLGDDAGSEDVLASIDTAQKTSEPDPAKFVPVSAMKTVTDQLAGIQEERVVAAVDDAVTSGKIPPVLREHWIGEGKKDFPALQSYLEKAPAMLGGSQIEGKAPSEKGKLSAEESAICAQQGLTEAEFLAARDEGNI